jgi:hypothetical protein
MTADGKNRIMICGPKSDGTYIVEFKTAGGEALAISIPASETRVIRHFQERMLMGCSCRMWMQNRKFCDGHHIQRLKKPLWMKGDLDSRGPSHDDQRHNRRHRHHIRCDVWHSDRQDSGKRQ